jgi:hypothetical protein
MERTVQVLAVHCVEAEFRHRGQLGYNARTCPLKRQGTAAAAHPHACLAKAAPEQRHAHHSSICGAARHTYARTHTNAHTRSHAHTHTRMHTHIQTQTHADTHRRAHAHTFSGKPGIGPLNFGFALQANPKTA